MEIKPFLLQLKNYIVAMLVFVAVFFLINKVYTFTYGAFLTSSDAEEKPNLPVRQIQSSDWFQGVVADVCNNQIMTIPYLLIDRKDSVKIEGWAVDVDNKKPLSDLYMEVDGNYYPAFFKALRDDVADLLSIERGNKLGFSLSFDRNILKSDHSNWVDRLLFHGVNYNGDSLLSPIEYRLLYVVDEPREPYNQYADVQFVLDGCSAGVVDAINKTIILRNDLKISLFGWCFENQKPLSELFILIGDKTFSLNYGVERQDVKNSFANAELSHVGYNFEFPASLLINSDGSKVQYVEFVPVDAQGRVCQKIRYLISYQ